jgi:hypothetical protein
MALAARFRQLDSSLDDFLFATIGEEENGMRLSVASALARRGMDPWAEARRLAGLPRAKATEALAALVGAIPLARWKTSDAPKIATRLSQLLPSSTVAFTVSGAKAPGHGLIRPRTLLWLLYAGFVAASLFSLMTERHSPAETQRSPTALHSVVSP